MDAPSQDTPSRRYQNVARFFRAYAAEEKMQLVPRPATRRDLRGLSIPSCGGITRWVRTRSLKAPRRRFSIGSSRR
jgi:hypothetical protein